MTEEDKAAPFEPYPAEEDILLTIQYSKVSTQWSITPAEPPTCCLAEGSSIFYLRYIEDLGMWTPKGHCHAYLSIVLCLLTFLFIQQIFTIVGDACLEEGIRK